MIDHINNIADYARVLNLLLTLALGWLLLSMWLDRRDNPNH